MSNEYHFEDERDLLGDMAPASFQPTDEWWRGFVAGLDVKGRRNLFAGELFLTVWNGSGMERVAVVAPAWVRELGAAGG